LRPGYSHVKDTISELYSPGSPNKSLLNKLVFFYALFTTLFGIGVWQFVADSGASSALGIVAGVLMALIGILNFITGFVFLQDPMGKPMTFSGMMHIALVGIMALLSLTVPLLFGLWLVDKDLLSGFGEYSIFSAFAILVSGLATLVITKLEKPLLGLIERVTIGVFIQWTVVIAIKLLLS